MQFDVTLDDDGPFDSDGQSLYEMSNFYPETTGLPFVVYLSTKDGSRHDVRVKVFSGKTVGRRRQMISVAIRPNIRIVGDDTIPGAQFKLLRRWIALNHDAILAHWNEEIDSSMLGRRLRKV